MAPFVYNFMKNLTARVRGIRCMTNSECESEQVCLANRCLFSNTTYYHGALSPGIQYDVASGYYIIRNASEPIWTESIWESTYMRLYLQDSLTIEFVVLFGGVFFLAASFLAVHLFLRYARNHMKIE
jgi:hypothetical protein